MNRIIALLTDFGVQDSFAGVMKGVIAKINPEAQVLDLNHEIPPQNIRRAAFELLVSVPYFPAGTLFVCVVDPGVGSQRRIIFAQTKNHFFIAPDNGLLSWVFKKEKPEKIIAVQNQRYFLKPVSHTFQGRDIFASVAGHWSRGVAIDKFGKSIRSYQKIVFPNPTHSKNKISGEILWIDRFGNLITNLPNSLVSSSKKFTLQVKNKLIRGVSNSYAQAKVGELLFLEGSHGFIEIALRNGSAAHLLKAKEAEQVKLNLI